MKKLSLILVVLLALACMLPALSESFTQPNIIPADSESAFVGQWELEGILFPDGTYYTAALLGVPASLNIVIGRASLTFNGQTYSSPSSLQSDGTLQAVDSDGTTSTFYLNDNGRISVEGPYDETSNMIMYFAPAQ